MQNGYSSNIFCKWIGLYLLIPTICLDAQISYASTTFFPSAPRITSQIIASGIKMGDIEIMAPIYGNQNRIWYMDAEGLYSSNTSGMGSMGTGIRNIIQDTWLLGGYTFFDWNKIQNKNHFGVVNPGVEFMYDVWDMHVNAYFPIHAKKTINSEAASSLGFNSYLYFHQHELLDKVIATYDIIGKGVDSTIGYTFPNKGNRARIFAGTYFYAPLIVGNIKGGQVGFEFPIKEHIKFILQNCYDNVFHNTAALTVQISFGNLLQSKNFPIQERMLDPIPRHLGTLSNGSGVLDQKYRYNTGNSTVIDNNIWFFQSGAGDSLQTITQESGTFEHPFSGLSQFMIDGINHISSNAKLFLAPGNYNNPNIGNGFTLNAGQSIFGRTLDYMQLATGNAKAIVNDTLFLNGGNVVNSVQVIGQSDVPNFVDPNITRSGIVVNNSSLLPVKIENVSIIASTSDMNHDARALLNFSPLANVSLDKSNVSAQVEGMDSIAIGIINYGEMSVYASNVASSNSGEIINGGVAIGVLNKSNLSIYKSNLTGNTTSTNAVGIGLLNEDFGSAIVTQSNIDVYSPSVAEGIFNEDFASVKIVNSSINTNSPLLSQGVFNEDFGDVKIINSNIFTNSSTLAEGVFNEDFATVEVIKSSIFTNSSLLSQGIFNEDFGIVEIANSNIFSNSSTIAEGIFNQDFASVKMVKSSITASSPELPAGIFNQDFGSILLSNSKIIANSNMSATGILNQDDGIINIKHSLIAVNGQAASPISNSASIINLFHKNLCFQNGNMVPCA